jgi:hypothetical protein
MFISWAKFPNYMTDATSEFGEDHVVALAARFNTFLPNLTHLTLPPQTRVWCPRRWLACPSSKPLLAR